MKREDDHELWDLLGRSEPPAVSPFFARNVIRKLRQRRRWQNVVGDWLTGRRAIPAVALAVVLCTAATFTMLQSHGTRFGGSQDDIPEVVARIDPGDYEVVADLDDLLASQEDDSWDDSPTL